ncbi:MAG TPA: hypothetical protein VJB89_00560 [Candidatus Nanoarchaeia archaeon]|nr:hypothetical protein [Candidatus Nanoarchaeia archaeon]
MDYLDRLIKGEIKPYQLESLFLAERNVSRNEWIEIEKRAQFLRRRYYEFLVKRTENLPKIWDLEDKLIAPFSSPDCKPIGKPQIENCLIGSYGFVGPVIINGCFARGEYYPVLSTSETQLIRAVNAGASHAKKFGGVDTIVEDYGMTRAPLFKAISIEDATNFIGFVKINMHTMKKIIKHTMNHCRLMDIMPFVSERDIHLRMRFNTGESMGMNKATFAAHKLSKWLVSQYGSNVSYKSVSGNMCTDKKQTLINVILGRGKRVLTFLSIPIDYLDSYLARDEKTVNDFIDIVDSKNMGSDRAGGMIGSHNTHVANVIGGMFPAYRQDNGHIVTSSMADKDVETNGRSLIYSLDMYCLEVGTVGGGIEYEPANTLLQALGCRDLKTAKPYRYSARKFAEIIGATALCAELGTDLALTRGVLADYHEEATRR